MFELPDYEIIIWIIDNKFGKNLKKDIFSKIEIVPYESMDYEGISAIHFDFQTWNETVDSAEKIKNHIDNPNLIFLKASNRTRDNVSIVFKDERPMKRSNQNE